MGGQCNCGVKPVTIQPEEDVNDEEDNYHTFESIIDRKPKRHSKIKKKKYEPPYEPPYEPDIVQKTIITNRPNNTLLYLLLFGILIIIILLINRTC